MSNEELHKKMEFIVEQLADLTVKQQTTEASVNAIAGNLNRLAGASLNRFERIEGVLGALAEAQVKTGEHVTALAEAQLRTDKKMADTDERLNSLITVVERYISEGHNGKPQG